MVETEKVEKKETAQKNSEKIEEQPTAKTEKQAKNEKPKGRPVSEVILHPKPSNLLLLLLQDKQWHTAALARDSGQSYVYATELIKIFEKSGVISVSSSGRRRVVKLTEKGEHLAHSIEDIMKASTEEPKPPQKTA